MSLSRKLSYFFLLFSLIIPEAKSSTVRVVNRTNNSTDQIRTLDDLRGVYVSVKDVSRVLSPRQPFVNADRLKMVLYIGNNRLKISGNSSYILVDERVYQMPSYAIWNDDDIYVQAEALFNLIRETTMPGIGYDSRRMVLDIDIKEFNITGIEINEKANGTILRIKTIVNASQNCLSPPRSTIKLPKIAPQAICIAPKNPLAEATHFCSTDESARTKTFAKISPLPNPNIKQAKASVNGVLSSGISDKNIKVIDNKHQEHPKRENLSRPSQLEYLLLTIFPSI